MSVASVVGYLNGGNTVNSIGYSYNIPTVAPVLVNTGATETILNPTVIPKGKWLITGTLGITCADNTKFFNAFIVIFAKNGVDFYDIGQGGQAYFSVNHSIPSLVFESDGTNELSARILATTTAGQWSKDADGIGNFITLVKIAN